MSEEEIDTSRSDERPFKMNVIEKHIPFLCRIGWHKVKEITEFDGCSLHGICVRCGKECMQDSQGNWF